MVVINCYKVILIETGGPYTYVFVEVIIARFLPYLAMKTRLRKKPPNIHSQDRRAQEQTIIGGRQTSIYHDLT